jgi:hypothetical protein
MKQIPNERQIYISARVWHELYPKLNLTPFIYALHEGIDLAKYGAGLKKFYFNFLIDLPENQVLEPYLHYSRKKMEADISVRIPYHQFQNASPTEVIQLMEKAYLEGIEQLKNRSLAGDFAIEAFKADVQAIFAKENWYELAETE